MKIYVALTLCIFLTCEAPASENNCSKLGLKEAFSETTFKDSVVCYLFVKTTDNESDTSGLSVDPDGISIYSLVKGKEAERLVDLPYAGTNGKIVDAFTSSADEGGEPKLYIIHSFELPSSWEALSDIYNVTVLSAKGDNLVVDKKASRYFGMGADLTNANGHIFQYPYKSKEGLQSALNSLLYKKIMLSATIKGRLIKKTPLYLGEFEPIFHEQTSLYKEKDSAVLIDDSTKGWCRTKNLKSQTTINVWLECSALSLEGYGQ